MNFDMEFLLLMGKGELFGFEMDDLFLSNWRLLKGCICMYVCMYLSNLKNL